MGKPAAAPLLILFGWLLPVSVSAQPNSFVADYELSRNGIPVAHTRLSLDLRDDGAYLYRARTEPNVLISLWREDLILEQSTGRLIDGSPRPDNYYYQRVSGSGGYSVTMAFDWEKNRVRIGEKPRHWFLDLEPGTLDKFVQQLALSHELDQGADVPRFTVADGGKLKEYSYKSIGKESVETPMGRYETLKLERHKDDAESDYTLWLAPVLDYLPIRILRLHNGARYLMEIEDLDRTRD